MIESIKLINEQKRNFTEPLHPEIEKLCRTCPARRDIPEQQQAIVMLFHKKRLSIDPFDCTQLNIDIAYIFDEIGEIGDMPIADNPLIQIDDSRVQTYIGVSSHRSEPEHVGHKIHDGLYWRAFFLDTVVGYVSEHRHFVPQICEVQIVGNEIGHFLYSEHLLRIIVIIEDGFVYAEDFSGNALFILFVVLQGIEVIVNLESV